ncbi:MAG: ATP-binding protein [Saprospiraceae bacterium]
MRKHFSQAAFGNVVLCGAWGALYMFYGDYLQSIGLWIAAGLSYAFMLKLKSCSIFQMQILSLKLFGATVLLVSLVFPLGPVLLSYFLPLTQVFFSLSKKRSNALIIIGAALLFPIAKWILGWDTLLLVETPVKHALAICTVVASAMAWLSVDGARRHMDSYMLKLRASHKEIDEQNGVIAAQQEKIAGTNRGLELITERLAVQASREELMTQDLLEKTDDQQCMVHAIHHDLKEPLRNIVSFTQLIERKLSTRPEALKAIEYLAFAKDGGNRMTEMLDDLLRYTKDVDEEMVEVDLERLISQLNVDLADTIQRNSGNVNTEDLPVVIGLPTQMRQLFQNLISNALKFSKEEENPVIHITHEYVGNDNVNIHVFDNGIGIPKSQMESVFKLFNRADNSISYKGSGVGLSLCKKICLRHGADIVVKSALNVGSTFSILGLELAVPGFESVLKEKKSAYGPK